MNETEFRKLAEEKGYGEIQAGEVEPGYDEDMHTHDYSVLSLTTAGEFILTTEDGRTSVKAGEWCEIPAHSLHKEQTGSETSAYMMAKK